MKKSQRASGNARSGTARAAAGRRRAGSNKKFSVKAFIIAHKKAVGVGGALLCLVLVALIVLFSVFSSDIFRAAKVARVELGASQAQVSAVLGEPHRTSADGDSVVWYYYERRFRGWLTEYNKEEALDGTVYKQIRIAFDADGVCEVLLDKKHVFSVSDEYATVAKTVKRVETETLEAFEKEAADGSCAFIPTADTKHAAYSAYYTDGSFYRVGIGDVKGTSQSAVSQDGGKAFRLRWQDRFAQYDVQVQVALIGRIDVAGVLTDIYVDKTEITIPSGVTEIAAAAFADCPSLKILSFPAGLKKIGASAFEDCANLSQVHMTDLAGWCAITFENSYSNPLYYAHSLYLDGELVTSLALPAGITAIPDYAFRGAGCLREIILPQGLETIGISAFADCRGVTDVRLPDSVKSLGRSAFEGCDKLREVILSTSLDRLEHSTFSGCDALERMTIPDRVAAIGDYAFFGCGSMKELVLGAGLRYIGGSAFAGCGGLESIAVSPQNSTYHSAGNCLIETEEKTLILGCAKSRIPADGSVTSIGRYAFIRCMRLTNITIPKSVTAIGSYAFYSCTGLRRVIYEGTAAEWQSVTKGTGWDEDAGSYTIDFADGTGSE